jgi:NADPH:quinone reductase-like Zn-dependent oxidoreductase
MNTVDALPTTMSANTSHRYGPPAMLQWSTVDRPEPGEGRVLVKVHASSVNPLDWHSLTGTPWIVRGQSGLRRPKSPLLGTDVAGVVVAVGPGVTELSVGDEVFGGSSGAFAEFATSKATSLALKPPSLGFEQAAALPIAAVTALQALRDKGKVGAGSRVLINGASGGVGTFAVQIAVAMGAHVTAVCSGGNVEMVRGLGAHEVIDYTSSDFVAAVTQAGGVDVFVDCIGNRSIRQSRRVLRTRGVYVVVGGPKKGRVLGPMSRLMKAAVVFAFSRQKAAPLLASLSTEQLTELAKMVEEGTLAPVIDRTYPMSQAKEALEYLGTGRVKGKVVLTADR